MPLVLDASILVKIMVREPGSEEALRMLDQHDELIAPDLVRLEVAAALINKVKREGLAVPVARRMFAAMSTFVDILEPSEALVAAAFDIGLAVVHPPHDCLYLALALEKDGTLLTADRKFVQAIAQNGYSKHVELFEWTE